MYRNCVYSSSRVLRPRFVLPYGLILSSVALVPFTVSCQHGAGYQQCQQDENYASPEKSVLGKHGFPPGLVDYQGLIECVVDFRKKAGGEAKKQTLKYNHIPPVKDTQQKKRQAKAAATTVHWPLVHALAHNSESKVKNKAPSGGTQHQPYI